MDALHEAADADGSLLPGAVSACMSAVVSRRSSRHKDISSGIQGAVSVDCRCTAPDNVPAASMTRRWGDTSATAALARVVDRLAAFARVVARDDLLDELFFLRAAHMIRLLEQLE